MSPKTDLHTHFAGVLSAQRLIEMGLTHDLKLDAQTAKTLKFVDAGYEGDPPSLRSLQPDQLKTLESAMGLKSATQVAPYRLNEIYRTRKWITDDRSMFSHLLKAMGEEYAGQGVKYAELSYAGIVSTPEMTETIHRVLQKIEKDTGVKLRFLAGLWRHADDEWNLDEIDRCKTLLQSPYIVGVDVMGFERNSIRPLAQPLKEMIAWAADHVPGFVMRLHAGESSHYAVDPSRLGLTKCNNTHESVKIFEEGRALNPDGPYSKQLQARIGHGRYGLFPQTLDLMHDQGVIVELCLTSNFVLNNADNMKAPFDLFNAHAVSYVLSSDGYGTYGTTLPNELAAAKRGGLTEVGEGVIRETELNVLDRDSARFERKKRLWQEYERKCAAADKNPYAELANVIYGSADGKPRWTPEIGNRIKTHELKKPEKLLRQFKQIGVSVDQEAIEGILATHRPIVFSGSSKDSWDRISPAQKENIKREMRALLNAADPKKSVIMTSGMHFGFDGCIHDIVQDINVQRPEKDRLNIIGAFVTSTRINEVKPGMIDYAMLIKADGKYAESRRNQAPGLLDLVEQHDGIAVMGGGSQVVRDMIVEAETMGLIAAKQVFLFNGPEGASTDKSKCHPEVSFKSFSDIIGLIDDPGKIFTGNFCKNAGTAAKNSVYPVAKQTPPHRKLN